MLPPVPVVPFSVLEPEPPPCIDPFDSPLPAPPVVPLLSDPDEWLPDPLIPEPPPFPRLEPEPPVLDPELPEPPVVLEPDPEPPLMPAPPLLVCAKATGANDKARIEAVVKRSRFIENLRVAGKDVLKTLLSKPRPQGHVPPSPGGREAPLTGEPAREK
jgi:hypothetical protein